MKIKISKNILLGGIQTVIGVVSSKSTLPILSNILLETTKDKLKLNTTDLDIGISCEIAVEIIEEGSITIPAKRFYDVIRELPEGDVVVHAKKNNQIDIEGKLCRFKLHGLPKEEFPKFPEFKDREVIKLEQSAFKEMLQLTSFAVSHEESRYVLNGVLLEIVGNSIRLVATDGRRLAKIEKFIGEKVKEDVSVIIPIKAVHEIMRNLKDEGVVLFVIGVNQALFDIDGVLIATRLIEGEFPNYNQVIPKAADKKIKMKTGELLASIRRANLLSTPDFQAVKFEIFTDKMVISKSTPDVGESREEILVEYGGAELVVGFNPQFLIDFLKNIDEELIEMMYEAAKQKIGISNNRIEQLTGGLLNELNLLKERESSLTDGFASGSIRTDLYDDKIRELNNSRIELERQLNQVKNKPESSIATLERTKEVFLEAKNAKNQFLMAKDSKRHQMLNTLLWNAWFQNKEIQEIQYKKPYSLMASTPKNADFLLMSGCRESNSV